MEVIAMKALSLSGAKIRRSSLVDVVQSTGEDVQITKNGSPADVLVSPGEFENLKETAAIRSGAALMREIREGLKELKRKKARLETLETRVN